MNKPVVIFGTGQMASIAHFYLNHDSKYAIAAFTVDQAHRTVETFEGLPVIPFEEMQKKYPPENYAMFLPLSYARMNKVREEKYNQAKQMGYELISYVNSKATTWPGLKVGENCFILENNVIQPFVEIGNNVILWSGNHIGHHTKIQDHCYLASHIVVSGRVTIEPNCFIGVNATIRDAVTIRRETLIGAGCIILKNTKEREVYSSRSSEIFPKTSDQLTKI